MSRPSNPYQDDRGNKDRSITKAGGGEIDTTRRSGPTSAARGGPFLAAENMTGGYGASDILHDCTLTVERAKSPSSSARTARESPPR